MQLPLFGEELSLPARHKTTGGGANGAKDATSRYVGLKAQLDLDLLNQNWRTVDTCHTSDRPADLNFIDLFSGAGGMSVGFRQAGLHKIFSVEVDTDASATIRRNFPESTHFEGSIEAVSDALLNRVIGARPIHLICGGPPCQGFSVAGLRKPHDPRNALFRQYIRIVEHVQPDYVVLENVPGILTMDSGAIYREIIRQFAEIGYPGMSVRILEAAEFGVPQLRTRAIFIANRLGRANPYPKAQVSKAHYRSIESAIEDLKDVPREPAINHEWTAHSAAFVERLRQVPPGGSLYPTFRDAWKRQYRGVPCMTIKENHGGVHVHYEKDRVLSAREMARLQTFPDDYLFAGTMKRAYWQIGNAVPCLLAQHIACAIRSDAESREAGVLGQQPVEQTIQAAAPRF